MYDMQWLAHGSGLKVRFLSRLDARLLYVCGYHCVHVRVVFTHANLFTNYDDYFPFGCFVHIVRFQELVMTPPDQLD
jgi:hypothetical protein